MKPIKNKVSQYADYQIIYADLSQIADWLKQSIEVFYENDSIAGAIFAAASLVKYARCFATGKRSRLDINEIVSEAKGEPLKFHEVLIGLRNKHIAHSVNSFEQSKVGVSLDKDQNITSYAFLSISLSNWEKEGLTQFLNFTNMVKKYVGSKIDELAKELNGDLLGANIHDLDLEMGKELKLIVPSPDDVSAPR